MRSLAFVVVFALAACVATPFPSPLADAGPPVDGGSVGAGDAGILAATQCSGTADSGYVLPPGSGCHADRALATCVDSGGTTVCLSDGATGCGTAMACQDACAATEYGVECGGSVPPGDGGSSSPSFLLPGGCTPAAPSEAGGAFFYCCPCS